MLVSTGTVMIKWKIKQSNHVPVALGALWDSKNVLHEVPFGVFHDVSKE